MIVGRKVIIQRANWVFLDLMEVGSKGSVVGEKLARWLWRPGADMAVPLAKVNRHCQVHLFSTTMQGEFGGEAPVEIAAADRQIPSRNMSACSCATSAGGFTVPPTTANR